MDATLVAGWDALCQQFASAFTRPTWVTFLHIANDYHVLIARIETVHGLENMESILAVEGIDAVFFGHGDYSQSAGLLGQMRVPEVLAAEERFYEPAHGRGRGRRGTPVVNYSDVQGGWTGAGGAGNASSDPLFVDAERGSGRSWTWTATWTRTIS